jgi:hypothetical protein
MFPKDSQTIYYELQGVGTHTLVGGLNTKYLLGISIQQSATNSTSRLLCGTTTIIRNYGKDFAFNHIYYTCSDLVIVDKTGQDSASFVLTYTTTNPFTPTPIATTSANFSYVDIASSSALATGIHNSLMFFFVFALIVVMYIGWRFGVWLYRR